MEKTTLIVMLITMNNENKHSAFIIISVFPQVCFIMAFANSTISIVMTYMSIL